MSDPGIEFDGRSPGDPARPLFGLHAKVLAFETERHAHLFLGSANATGQAFRNNVEILLELIGPHDRLGIDALIAAGAGRARTGIDVPALPAAEPEEPPAGRRSIASGGGSG